MTSKPETDKPQPVLTPVTPSGPLAAVNKQANLPQSTVRFGRFSGR